VVSLLAKPRPAMPAALEWAEHDQPACAGHFGFDA
jgi:hypothetical protein